MTSKSYVLLTNGQNENVENEINNEIENSISLTAIVNKYSKYL